MLNNLLQTRFPNDNFSCVYNISVGTITISSTTNFRIMTDDFVKTLQGISTWHGNDDEAPGHPGYYNLRYINEVLLKHLLIPLLKLVLLICLIFIIVIFIVVI